LFYYFFYNNYTYNIFYINSLKEFTIYIKNIIMDHNIKYKNFTDLIKEAINPSQLDVDVLKQKEILNPKIWETDEKIKDEVRKYILLNAYQFIKFLKIDNLRIKDVTLTGSIANYNWNEDSDIDIHILMDFSQISNNPDFVREFFMTKKELWNEKDIKIKNYDVELYVQDVNEEHTSTGVYSVLKNEWISKPIKQMITIDVNNVKQKTMDFIQIIESLSQIKDPNTLLTLVNKLKDKIKKYRKSGLSEFGEYSTENLVFKLLRNYGYLDMLSKYKEEVIKNKLTFENY